MMNGTARRILLIAAGTVFLFSSIAVSKYHLELHSGTEYAEALAQMVVAPRAEQSAEEPEKEPAGETANILSGDVPAQISGEAAIRPSDIAAMLAAEENTGESISNDSAYDSEESIGKVSEEIPVQAVKDAAGEPDVDTPMRGAGEVFDVPSNNIPAQATQETIDKPVRVAPIQVDFDELCAKNPDVVAWLYSPNTPINYPVVQADDNRYYMHRRLDGSRSYPGTLFMDFRNTDDFSDWNSVIYGHNMRNGSMFGTLQKYKGKTYLESHSEIYLLTPERNYVIDVLAGFVTTDDAELYGALRPDDAEKERLMKKWLEDAGLAPERYPAPEKRLVTLSTCSYEYKNARYVLLGILEELTA